MNLIDADKLIKQLDDDIKITSEFVKKSIKYDDYRDFDKSFAVLYMLKSYRAIVEGMPTAFDVEKVVEQLDNLRKEYKMEANNINIPHNYSCYYKGHMRGYEHSIDIVKRGVIDENIWI